MDYYLGQIQPFGFGFAPKNWMFCQGQQLPISQYTALYSLLGVNYGGDGRTYFNLPNLQGLVPFGAVLPNVGAQSGEAAVTLDQTTMASHYHNLVATTATGTVAAAANAIFATSGVTTKVSGDKSGIVRYSTGSPNTTLASQALTVVGGGKPHNNMQPYISVNYCICVSGVFPPRS